MLTPRRIQFNPKHRANAILENQSRRTDRRAQFKATQGQIEQLPPMPRGQTCRAPPHREGKNEPKRKKSCRFLPWSHLTCLSPFHGRRVHYPQQHIPSAARSLLTSTLGGAKVGVRRDCCRGAIVGKGLDSCQGWSEALGEILLH
jgi:hypothetical protein